MQRSEFATVIFHSDKINEPSHRICQPHINIEYVSVRKSHGDDDDDNGLNAQIVSARRISYS